MSEKREGPPMIYVPVCKHPRDYLYTAGPMGYERVEQIGRCPLLVEPEGLSEQDQEAQQP